MKKLLVIISFVLFSCDYINEELNHKYKYLIYFDNGYIDQTDYYDITSNGCIIYSTYYSQNIIRCGDYSINTNK